MLGPVLFVMYTVDLVSLIESHSLSPHLYADDTQVYGSCSLAAVDALSVTISEYSADVASWMRSNRLQLNSDRRRLCGVLRTDANINFPLPLCRSMECLLTLCRLFATW